MMDYSNWLPYYNSILSYSPDPDYLHVELSQYHNKSYTTNDIKVTAQNI